MLVSHPRTVAAIATAIAVLGTAAVGDALTDGSDGHVVGSSRPVAVTASTLPGALDAIVGDGQDPAPTGIFPATPPPAATAPATPTLVKVSVPASTLAANGIPTAALRAYKRGAAAANDRTPRCRIPWPLVAAIGRVESDHGRFADNVLHEDGVSTPGIVGIPLNGNGTEVIRDTDGGRVDGDKTYDRAVGPMQFIPSTWVRWRNDADRDGKSDVNDIDDAAAATAAYLCANDRNLATYAGQRSAVLSYNHSTAYLKSVLDLEKVYARGVITVPTAPGKGDASKPKRPDAASPARSRPKTPAATAPATTAPSTRPVTTAPAGITPPKTSTPKPTSPKPSTSKPTPKPTPTCPTSSATASPTATPSPSGTDCASATTTSAPKTATESGAKSATTSAKAATPSPTPTS